MDYTAYNTLKIEFLDEGIILVSLNRPRQMNAVNHQMVDELTDLWASLKHDVKTRVVLLQGSGEKGFCGGLDVKENLLPEELKAVGFYDFQSRLGQLELAMRQIPQPIICMVHGAAAGAGFSFALASDIRVISEDARFSAFFINVGVGGADMSCSYFLPRIIGSGRAYEFMLTGRFMNAEEAMMLGLASRCVERDQLLPTALELARDIAAKDYLAIRLTKEAINQNIDCPGLEAALKVEDRNQTLMILHNQQSGRSKAFA
jgi:Enoyl-CoA hydratase/carnithine racemase